MNKTKVLNDNVEIFIKRKTNDESITGSIVQDFNALLDLMQDLGCKVILAKDSDLHDKFRNMPGVLIINEMTNNTIYLGRLTTSFDGKSIREIYACFIKFGKPNDIKPFDTYTTTIYIDPDSRINDCAILLEKFLNTGNFPKAESCINYVRV